MTNPINQINSEPPHIRITNCGNAHQIQINGKTYQITSLHIKKRSSNQWQAIDISGADPIKLAKLAKLATYIQHVADTLGDQFNPENAKSFSFIANRAHVDCTPFSERHAIIYKYGSKISTRLKNWMDSRPLPKALPFEFHEITFKEEGEEEFIRIKLSPEFYDDKDTQAALMHHAKEAGEAARDLARFPVTGKKRKRSSSTSRFSPATTTASSSRTSSRSSSRSSSPGSVRLAPVECGGKGNCQVLSIAEALRHLSPEKQADIKKDLGVSDLNNRQLHQVLREKAMDRIRANFNGQEDLEQMARELSDHGEKNVNSTTPDLIDSYIKYFRQQGKDLDQLSLKALTEILQIPIAVFTPDRRNNSDTFSTLYAPSGISHQGLETDGLITIYQPPGHYQYIPLTQPEVQELLEKRKADLIRNLERAFNDKNNTNRDRDLETTIDYLKRDYPRLFNELINELKMPNDAEPIGIAVELLKQTDFTPIRNRLSNPKPTLTVEEPE